MESKYKMDEIVLKEYPVSRLIIQRAAETILFRMGYKSDSIFCEICSEGCLEFAKWFVKRFPQTMKKDGHYTTTMRELFFSNICQSQNRQFIEWFSESYPDVAIDLHAISNVFLSKDFEFIEWFLNKFSKLKIDCQGVFEKICAEGDLELVKWFLKKFPQTNVHYASDRAFTQACGNGHHELVKWFLEQYPETQIHDDDQYNDAVLDACEEGHLEVIKILLEKYPGKIRGVFYTACRLDQVEIAKWIAENHHVPFNKYLFREIYENKAYKVAKWCEVSYFPSEPEPEFNSVVSLAFSDGTQHPFCGQR